MARKTWTQMTKAERRVAIAKDVIKILERPNIKAEKGIYLYEVDGKTGNFGCKIPSAHKCTVCAKGGLMVAFMSRTGCNAVRDVNGDIGIGEYRGRKYRSIDGGYIMRKLGPTFGAEQLDLIEKIFELWGKSRYDFGFDPSNTGGISFESAELLASQWNESNVKPYRRLSAKRRIIGIMGNIIKNKGTFIPEQGPVFFKARKRVKA